MSSAARLSRPTSKLVWVSADGLTRLSTSSVVATETGPTRCVMMLSSRRRTGARAVATQRWQRQGSTTKAEGNGAVSRAPGRPCFERRPSAGLTLPMTGIATEHMARAYVLDRDHRLRYVSGEPGAAALHRPPYRCRIRLATKHSVPSRLPAGGRMMTARRRTASAPVGAAISEAVEPEASLEAGRR
jgi:hypothetical protein